jgi:hypothetical protein
MSNVSSKISTFRLEYSLFSLEDGVHFSLDGGLLSIDDRFAAELAKSCITNIQTDGGESSTSMAAEASLAMLLPEHPAWTLCCTQFPDEVVNQITTLALRFYVNSGVLWRLRSSRRNPLHLQKDARFLYELSEFKAFNYHLFDYWSSLCTPHNVREIHLPLLSRFIRRNPSNFSPFHMLVATLRKAEDPLSLFNDIFRDLNFHEESILKSVAYTDFMVSAGLLLAERLQIRDLPECFSPFVHEIDSLLDPA